MAAVLAQHSYLQNPAFINYLAYLQYWKRPEYAKFILCAPSRLVFFDDSPDAFLPCRDSYPHCLYFLDQLQQAQFRQRLVHPDWVMQIHVQQYFHWKYNGQLSKVSLAAIATPAATASTSTPNIATREPA